MNPEQFVSVLRAELLDTCEQRLGQTLQSPPGRRPAQNLVDMSTWYRALREEDKTMVLRIARYAAESTLFGTLCVLDGAKVIEDPPERGELCLEHVNASGRTRLNPPDVSLHDFL